MGHAGAYIGAGEKSARAKIQTLEKAGVVVVNHPSRFGSAMKTVLGNPAAFQKRSLHTHRVRYSHQAANIFALQRRELHTPEADSLKLLEDKGVHISTVKDPDAKDYFLTVTFDRNNYQPCVISSYSIGGKSAHNHANHFPLN